MPDVSTEILTWARETAGLSLESAAAAININYAYGQSGAERLAELEAGTGEPTRSQLVRMSQKYRRPLLIFYLNKPPRKGDRGEDFRTLPDAPDPTHDATLDALIRDIRTRQNLIRSLLEDEEAPRLDFINSANYSNGPDYFVNTISERIDFRRDEFRSKRSYRDAFKYLRKKVEDVGVFVMLMGNLGSYHSNIPVKIFRGFAIADAIAPFITINDQDAQPAWSFTMLHEITHLWLGKTGISGQAMETRIEQFCNDVASEILLPERELLELLKIRGSSFDDLIKSINKFSSERNLSRSMIAYRLYKADHINKRTWEKMRDQFREEWLEKKKNGSGSPDYYTVRRYQLGRNVLSLVRRSLDDEAITYTKAGKVLRVKPGNIKKLLGNMPPKSGDTPTKKLGDTPPKGER